MKMKTLTIKNPWSYLIFHGKDVENRTWRTNYRGDILIHSAKKWSYDYQYLLDHIPYASEYVNNNHKELLCGAIIGKVTIIDCINDSNSVWAQKDYWHWILKNPILFDKPIPNIRGQLGLWEYGL